MAELELNFKKVDYRLSDLLRYIEIGDIALPNIQRPFVWTNTKVRDLLDSMYRGFPVGYLMFWEIREPKNVRWIGLGEKERYPARLIIDGQQRLTSLYAVFRGKKVLGEDYQERRIEIAFRPRDGKFEVCNSAIRYDPEWIPNISEIWSSGASSYQIIKAFLERLEAKRPLSSAERGEIEHNLERLFSLQSYPFTALEIAPTVDEEQIAEIFVRINSEGVRLNQSDFILTLMSVFWNEGRIALEEFCKEAKEPPKGGKPSPFNHIIHPSPDELLRVSVVVGFGRGRFKPMYNILRGKDMETGEFSPEVRERQFNILREAQERVLNLINWHGFLSAILGAGFRSKALISSQSALLYAYAFWLIGKDRFKMPEYDLGRLIGRWFFFTSLTSRYSASPDNVIEADLSRLKGANSGEEFAQVLDSIMSAELTKDFWEVTLPARLATSYSRSPEISAYIASQVLLGAPVLFSHKRIGDLLDPALRGRKKPLEKHHLFPRAWLEKQGITDRKLVGQQANFAFVEWPDNLRVKDKPPFEYVPELKKRFKEDVWKAMHEMHALPEGWETMPYEVFLEERRKRMAALIRRGYESLL